MIGFLTVSLMALGQAAHSQTVPVSQPAADDDDGAPTTAPASTTGPESASTRPAERRLGAYQSSIHGLLDPIAVAIDDKKRIYVAEAGRHQVAVFDQLGEPIQTIGRRGFGEGELHGPAGVAVAPDGHVYISDSGNHRIAVFDRSGRFVRQWGGYGTAPGRLIRPMGLTIAGEGVYVADAGNDRVQVFDRQGATVRCIGEWGLKAGQFRRPIGVAVDRARRLYVLDRDNNRVQVFDGDGGKPHAWGEWGPYPGMLGAPRGICLHEGRLYAADTSNHRIQVLDPRGRALYQWGIHAFMPREGDGKLHFPSAVAVAPDGAFAVVCEGFENRCQIFGRMPPGEMPPTSPFVQNDPSGQSHFGVSVGLSRRLVALSEEEIDQVSIHNLVDGAAVRISMVGQHGVRPGQFIRPTGLDLDADRSMLVVGDAGNRRLHVFRLKQDPPGSLRFIPQMAELTRSLDFAALRPTTPGLRDRPVIEPTFIRRGANETLIVLDAIQCVVVVLDKELKVQQVWPMAEDQPPWVLPTDVALDAAGKTVHVCDAGRGAVIAYTTEGRRQREWKADGLSSPGGVAVGSDGTLFVSDEFANRIFKFDAQGKVIGAWGTQGLGAGQLHRPRGLAMTDAGDLLVVDHGNHRCQLFSVDGKYRNVFGATFFVRPALRGESEGSNEE